MAKPDCCHTVLLAIEQFVLASSLLGVGGPYHRKLLFFFFDKPSEVVLPKSVIRYKKTLKIEMGTDIIIVIRLFRVFLREDIATCVSYN